MKMKASCSCGQLRLSYEGELFRNSMCHCLACQKRTGSAFGIQTRIDRLLARIEGKSTVYLRPTDEGDSVRFHFCGQCGATVYWEVEDLPDYYVVPVGALENPNFPAPTVSVYETRKHHWVVLPDSVNEHWD